MLKYKANIANQRHRRPPSRGIELNKLEMQPAAFEFFDIEEFLEDNFEKSRKEILLNTDTCQMREKRGFDCDSSKRNRYSMPPIVQARNFGLTNNHLLQSKQRLAMRSKIENDDESILRKKQPDLEQDPAVRSVLRNVTNRGDANETSTEMRNSAPEFLLRAQRVRQSWVEQNGNRIEKLLTENRHSDGPVSKRHSIAVSNMVAKFGETTKFPKPKLLPKPRSPKKTDTTLMQQENGLKPIIPAVPKHKVEETSEKSKDRYTFRIESSPPKSFVPKESSIEETKEEKDEKEEIKENGDASKQIMEPTTPTKPSLTLQKPAVLPVKPTHLSPVRKSFPVIKDLSPVKNSFPVIEDLSPVKKSIPVIKDLSPVKKSFPVIKDLSPVKKSFPVIEESPSPSQKCEENEQVIIEETSQEKKAVSQVADKPNKLSKLIKMRPPIAIKPMSLHRVKSDTEISRLHIKSKYNNKPADSRTNSVGDENKRKTTLFPMTNHTSQKDDDIENQNADEKKLETSDETNRKQSSSLQQSNCNSPITPKNGTTTTTTTTTTDRSPIIKEKPIFAFLKAKEATNQQSFYKGSELNRNFISSGLGRPTSVYLNSKDSIQEFGNSKPIIPQSKIITY